MKIIFVTGGARSGKSDFACRLAAENKGAVTYIATAEPGDIEMKKRIEKHRRKRPRRWKLVEEPVDMKSALSQAEKSKFIIIDCLTLLITNWMLKKNFTESKILGNLSDFLPGLKKLRANVVIVSNEVGAGIVPGTKLGRTFRDICGQANQLVADHAEDVYFLVSGIPLKIK